MSSKNVIPEKLIKLKPYNPDIDNCKIHLDANENCMDLPDNMRIKVADAVLKVSFNRYPDPLAKGICEAFGKLHNIPARYITAGNGSDELISLLFGSFMQKGDKVLIPEPDFSMYAFYCSLSECKPVKLEKDSELHFTAENMIETAKREGVKLIIFSNPCNPTGQGLLKEDIIKIAEQSDCLVVADEAYMDFWDQSVLDYVTSLDNLIILKTCSKIGFAAMRLGFAIANSELTDHLRAAKSPYNINSLTQAAAEVVLNDRDYIIGMAEALKRSRDRLYKALSGLSLKYPNAIKVYPSHTNFVFVKSEYAAKINQALRQNGISIRFLNGCYLRITAGLEEENKALIAALEQILSSIA